MKNDRSRYYGHRFPPEILWMERCPTIDRQTSMSIELSEDERKLVIQALEHYDAYLHATSRRDGHAKELAERLQGQNRTLAERPTNRKEVHRRRT